MRPDTRMEDARRRMELRPPIRLTYEGQLNDDPNPRSEYPRMMYRKTDEEQIEMLAGSEGFSDIEVRDKERVINRFDGLLCDTMIAQDIDHAEELSASGWDVSPKAAYGLTGGLVPATTAKDNEIAELRRQLAEFRVEDAEKEQAIEQPSKRRGRPPKSEALDVCE